MISDQDKKIVRARIESLWADAAESLPPQDAAAPMPMLESKPPIPTPSHTMSRINRLMDEAEETHLRSYDSASDIDAIGSMVAAAEAAADTSTASPTGDNFEQIKSQFEDVSRLQPPSAPPAPPAPRADQSHDDNLEDEFDEDFSALVRDVVRDFIESDFEPVLRQAIQEEINHLDSTP